MAGSHKPGPIGLNPGTQSLEDGTNIRGLSPLPGPIHRDNKQTHKVIQDSISHYDVRKGDSLWSIAANHLGTGSLYFDLAKLNEIRAGDPLQIGQRLIVPNFQRYDLTVTYMLSEILKNANSAEVKAIAEAIARSKQSQSQGDKASEDLKKAKWYEVFRIYGDQAILNATIQQSGVAMAEAKARWFLQVRQGGPWDHKPILEKMYLSMSSPPRPFGTMGKAFHFPIRGDLFHEYYYDIWSNIHYGYVGSKCGFDGATLQSGAASGFPGAGGNDDGDIISVNIGIKLWNQSGLGINADMLRKAIIACVADYRDARSREISRGIREEDATNVIISGNDYK